MIIVADSGSTKTDWVILDQGLKLEFKTEGINPFFLDEKKLETEMYESFPRGYDRKKIEKVFFYGPGCSNTKGQEIIAAPIKSFFNNATLHVESDLLGAARALFKENTGIACILGTGSNSGLYNGHTIAENTTSAGYILGDEGSGANLGLTLVKQFINHQLEPEVEKAFIGTYNLSSEEIIDRVYRQAYPNRFLAQFSVFIYQQIKEPTIREIAEDSFSKFIDWHVLAYPDSTHMPVAFVGSVAYYFRQIIEPIAREKGIVISKIIQKPIDLLVEFHSKKEGI